MSRADPWPVAGRVAGVVGGNPPLASSYVADHLAADLPGIVARAAALVEEATGLEASASPEVVAVDRRGWAERNVVSMTRLLGPVEQALAPSTGRPPRPVTDVAPRLVGSEIGLVLGLLSRRVLGQYELVLPGDPEGDVMVFVSPNVLAMERAHQFRPAEFRLWVALHESAHRIQFLGVPWMRTYFTGLVSDLTAFVPRAERLATAVARVSSARREGVPVIGDTGVFGLFSSPEESATLDRVQALMTVLEGHGHAVMNRLGARILTAQPRMASILDGRQGDARFALLVRLIGLEMKYRQYREGERFIAAVEREAGWDAVSLVWASPEALPTLDEIAEPVRWLDRVA